MSMSNTTFHMGNDRAEQAFLASGIPDTEQNRRAIRADATYTQNHIGGRWSTVVAEACRHFPKLASPMALAILEG